MRSVSDLLIYINDSLANLNFRPQAPLSAQSYVEEIHAAHIYPLLAGGKRIRPLFTLLMAGSCGGEQAMRVALNPALAVEVLHTYSLVHDDLPCMDNDDLRRGRPTVHKVYGDAKALLVGDGLLTHAFKLLAQTEWQHKNYTKEIFEVLSLAASARGIVWGQWLDLSLTGKDNTTWELMETVHAYKTGVLIGASIEMGLLCGLSLHVNDYSTNKFTGLRKKAQQIGLNIGLAFQIIDDILDSTKTTQELGKTSGKDAEQNKFTAVRILGIKNAEELSAQYTELSLKLLKEIFNEINNAENNTENSFYQNIIIEQIQSLLKRSN